MGKRKGLSKMISFITDLVGGWRELRTQQGFSYQINRSGKRRVVPVQDYGRRGTIDDVWMRTGEFADEKIHRKFRNHTLVSAPRGKMQYASV
ncbi:hypothetical protein BH09PLA1_BH09PLA1_29690 [soil metagenome]